MDREEIRQQAEEYRQPYRGRGLHISSMDIKEAFEEGAEWMQKKMIDKAYEWIMEHINIPYEREYVDDSLVASDYIEWCEKRLECAKAVADTFKQAMEE